ncbi:MAG: hypothetical protein H6709_24690 [Kofleriaceae bacterium]|nr:hypothetical protein [Kofleriaceae bacterium]
MAERAAPDGAAPDDLARDAQAQALALAETLARQEQARRSTPGGLTRHVTVIAVAVVVLAGLVLWIRPQMTKSAEPAYAPAGGNVGQGSTAAGGSGSGSGSTDEDPHRRVGTGNHDLLGSGAGTGTASGASAGTGGVPEHVGIPGRDAGAGGAPSAVGKPRLDGGVPRAAIDAGAPARPIDAGVPDAGPVPDGPRPIDAGLAVDASTLAQRYDRLVEDATAAFDAGDVHTALRKAEQGIRMMPDEFNAYGVALVMSCHLRDRARMKKYLRVVRQRFSDREYFLTDLCLKAGVDPTE